MRESLLRIFLFYIACLTFASAKKAGDSSVTLHLSLQEYKRGVDWIDR